MKLKFEEMYNALLNKDSSYEGSFFAGIKTTGIFCRPTCTARKPKKENVEFFTTSKDAVSHGYRPCKVCHPLEHLGYTPEYIKIILEKLEKNPDEKIKDSDLNELNIEPNKVRRWFKKNLDITFHEYQRMLKINSALHQISGGEKIIDSAFDSGYNSLSGFSHAFKNATGSTPSDSAEINIINIMRFTTPLGPMTACATEKGIYLLEFSDRKNLNDELEYLKKTLHAKIIFGQNQYLDMLKEQIDEYFSGTRKIFDLPLHTPGTDFQNLVWKKLIDIPYGEHRSYKDQALAINKPKAVRAVGKANGSNRIAIIIPCHRIIGESGKLTGYAGGLWRKQWLLDFERKNSSL